MSPRTLALGAVLPGAGLALIAGSQLDGGPAQALALVAAAGGVLLLVLGDRGRRALGGLLALDAAGMIITGILRAGPSGTAWPVVLATAGLLVGTGAALTMMTSPRWPTRSGRYERDQPADDETAWWQALDAGIDPTVDPRSGDPDVHVRATPDTMGTSTSPSSHPGESEEPHGRH